MPGPTYRRLVALAAVLAAVALLADPALAHGSHGEEPQPLKFVAMVAGPLAGSVVLHRFVESETGARLLARLRGRLS